MTSDQVDGPVVVAVIAVGVMQMPVDEFVDVVAVPDGGVAAVRSVDVVMRTVMDRVLAHVPTVRPRRGLPKHLHMRAVRAVTGQRTVRRARTTARPC